MTVYFIRAGSGPLVKIGFTEGSALARMAALQVGCPDYLRIEEALDAGTQADERRLHVELGTHRRRGEWFDLSPECVREIAIRERARTTVRDSVLVMLAALEERAHPIRYSCRCDPDDPKQECIGCRETSELCAFCERLCSFYVSCIAAEHATECPIAQQLAIAVRVGITPQELGE